MIKESEKMVGGLVGACVHVSGWVCRCVSDCGKEGKDGQGGRKGRKEGRAEENFL
jgi:hypothetical protein